MFLMMNVFLIVDEMDLLLEGLVFVSGYLYDFYVSLSTFYNFS